MLAAIIEEWRAQSKRGRYEGQLWSAAALEELDRLGVSSNKARLRS